MPQRSLARSRSALGRVMVIVQSLAAAMHGIGRWALAVFSQRVTAKLLETVDTSRNEIAPLLGFFDRRFAVCSRRDHRLDAALDQVVPDRVAVIAFFAGKPVAVDIMEWN